MSTSFDPTRNAAIERLEHFLPHAGRDYAARRNYDLGAGHHTSVSTLSPWLRCRLITEQEVITSVLERHSASAAEKFIQEVFWRTYWKGWLELRPDFWRQYQSGLERSWNAVQTQSGLRTQWEAACKGDTGIDCFDAWAKELVATGYLHNHARMWFASIWIFTLKLPWELGADFFLRHLLDGDPASNTLSWRWVGGIQTRGKTYLARTSNISKFTEGRFHPKWQLANDAPPLDAPLPPDPRPLPDCTWPDPQRRTGFLLHDEDLSPDFVLNDFSPVATAILPPQTRVGPLQTADAVMAFRTAAQQDALSRWSERLGAITLLSDAKSLANWAQQEDLEQIVTAYAPTGPTASTIRQAVSATNTPKLHQIMRPYDKLTWPHATKGFFPFKKQIPDFILSLTRNDAT